MDFGNDPKNSALDVNCKAHEVDNLYVVDGSIFVSSAAVNPAQTGTKAAANYRLTLSAGETATVRLRFSNQGCRASSCKTMPAADPFTAARRSFNTIRIGAIWRCFTNTSTATTARGLAPAIKQAGPALWLNCYNNVENNNETRFFNRRHPGCNRVAGRM